MRNISSLFSATILLAACTGGAGDEAGTTQAYSGIAEDEVIDFGGTEPFWGGTIEDGTMTYSTPDNIGSSFLVERFAGNNGLSFTGDMNGTSVTMTVTPGECSDGMSDRTYPFTVTLQLGDAVRNGCAHTDRQPFTGPVAP